MSMKTAWTFVFHVVVGKDPPFKRLLLKQHISGTSIIYILCFKTKNGYQPKSLIAIYFCLLTMSDEFDNDFEDDFDDDIKDEEDVEEDKS